VVHAWVVVGVQFWQSVSSVSVAPSQSSSRELAQASGWLPGWIVSWQVSHFHTLPPSWSVQSWIPSAQTPGDVVVQAWVVPGEQLWQSASWASIVPSQSSSSELPQASAWSPGLIVALQGPQPPSLEQSWVPTLQMPGELVVQA